jgi:hypothetical protein
MDIWRWVTSASGELRGDGNGRLADILDRLSWAAAGGHEAEAHAMVCDGLVLAAGAGRPWIEVYLRHWSLQQRVAVGGEGESALSAVLEALEAAHRDDTAGCPQAVCTVQDLGLCYGNSDGPGWASHRLAVSAEALDGIDATWPCWACIHGEVAEALIDQGRPGEALDRLDGARAGVSDPEWSFDLVTVVTRANALLADGRPETAVGLIERFLDALPRCPGPTVASLRVLQALALVGAGRAAEAAGVLPEAAAVRRRDAARWAQAVEALVVSGYRANDDALGGTLGYMLDELAAAGSWLRGAQVAEVHTALALDRGDLATAEQAAQSLGDLVGRLRAPGDLAGRAAVLVAVAGSSSRA